MEAATILAPCLVAIDTAALPQTAAVDRQVTLDSLSIYAQMHTVILTTLPKVYLLVPEEPTITIRSSSALRTLHIYIYGVVVIIA